MDDMSALPEGRPRSYEVDWSAINRGMDPRTRAEFNRLHGRLNLLTDDLRIEVRSAGMYPSFVKDWVVELHDLLRMIPFFSA
jgi:hypothetical protein